MPRLIKLKNQTQIFGLSIRANNDEVDSKIVPLWTKFMDEIDDKSSEIYAVYFEYESDFRADYTFCIGTKKQKIGLKEVNLPSGTYAVFSKFGIYADGAFVLWQEIWNFFQKENTDLKRSYICDFELYKDELLEIYIGLENDLNLDILEQI